MAYILSVVIPTYNTERYLARCINSLLDDRVNGKVEIIIVNDGSTDNSLNIALDFKQKYPFIVVINKENGGHGSTINKGIDVASGKYFRVLDSDDWFDTEQFVLFVHALEKLQADVVVSWGYYEYTYKNKKVPYIIWNNDSHIEYGKVYNFSSFDFNGSFIVMAQLTYLSSIVKNIPRKIQEKTFYVDNEFILYPIVNVETLVFLDYYVYHYFIGRPEQSINKKVLMRNITHCEKVCCAILEFLDTVDTNYKKKEYMNYIALRVIKTYYSYLLLYFNQNWQTSYSLLRKFDNLVRRSNPFVYSGLNKTIYIRIYRKFPKLVMFVSPFIYSVYSFLHQCK